MHLNDGLLLSQVLSPATRIPVDRKIAADLARFLAAVAADASIDPVSLRLGRVTVAELVARITKAHQVDLST